jgi:hypothetical protein
MLNPKFLIGFTDTETVKLDLDETSFKDVKSLVEKTEKKFDLKGYLILKSSKNNYHVVFDREVCWSENVSIMAYAILTSHKTKLWKWFLLQCRRKASTLRLGSKKDKPPPRIVFRNGDSADRIRVFLKVRKGIKRFVSRCLREK